MKHLPTEDFSSEHQQALGNNEPLLRFSNPEQEAKSEVRKQECRADFLDSSVRDLQGQT